MMKYRFKAVDGEGRIHRGDLLALHPQALETALSERGLDLIRFRPLSPMILRFPHGVKRQALIQFLFQLEQLLSAGVPMLQALREVHDVEESPQLQTTIAALLTRVQGGSTLSEAFKEHPRVFDSVFTSLVHAGEQSGDLPEALHALGEMLNWQEEIAGRASRAMLYPAFLGIFIAGVSLFLFIYLVPKLVGFIGSINGVLPLHTRLLLAVSSVATTHWPWLISLPPISSVVTFLAFRRSHKVRRLMHRAVLRLPLMGNILRKLALARFCRTFALLYRAGIPVLDTLRIAHDVPGNIILSEAVDFAAQGIGNGESIHRSFSRTGLFPPLILRMLALGESTGGIDRSLLKAAEFFDRDARERLGKMETLMEPVLTLILGVLLGWIMLSVLGPLYDVTTRVRL